MDRFLITVPCKRITGHLISGSAEAVIEASSLRQALEKFKANEADYAIIDADYEIDSYELAYEDCVCRKV